MGGRGSRRAENRSTIRLSRSFALPTAGCRTRAKDYRQLFVRRQNDKPVAMQLAAAAGEVEKWAEHVAKRDSARLMCYQVPRRRNLRGVDVDGQRRGNSQQDVGQWNADRIEINSFIPPL